MLQGGIHMGVLQSGGAAGGVGTVSGGCCHRHAGGAGAIGVEHQVEATSGGMVKPNLGGAIDTAQGRLAEFGVQ